MRQTLGRQTLSKLRNPKTRTRPGAHLRAAGGAILTQHRRVGAQNALLPQASDQLITSHCSAAAVRSGQGLLQLQEGGLHHRAGISHDSGRCACAEPSQGPETPEADVAGRKAELATAGTILDTEGKFFL